MRLFFALVAAVTLGQAAIAQGQECKAVTDPSMRLACYDKATSPVATARTPRPAVEDVLLHERINGICRGC
jgi:hypothetical protein